VISIVSIYVVVLVNEGQRKIPVTYSKRIRGNRIYGGANTHIPLKVNTAGVIPIIFALSIMSFPTLIANFFVAAQSSTIRSVADFIIRIFDTKSMVYYGMYFLLVVGFTFFYTLVAFNPVDVADNLKKQGGFVPGIRPGQATVQYLSKILNRITLAGAFFLGGIAVMPFVIESLTNIQAIIGGTSLLILVSVILETMRQMEAQLIMRDYEHFLDR
jgi:preprotein translocase subunit SecY